MRKKKLDYYERNKLYQREEYNRTAQLKEDYPQLENLTIDMSFKTHDDWCENPNPKQEVYSPNSKAFFGLKCPLRSCVDGGFNLSAAVSKMVANGETKTSGTITCPGWQNTRRKHRCLLEMTYSITASY